MLDPSPVTELGEYSSPGAEATPWQTALDVLKAAQVCLLTTVRPDGRPHATPLLAAWADGGLCFTTGADERKAKNLAANQRCLMTTSTNSLTGLDVVVEGRAHPVETAAERSRAAGAYEAKYGHHLTSPEGTWYRMGDGIRNGTILLFRIDPTVAFAFSKAPMYSQTRYTFTPSSLDERAT